jgi:hypothetical protein
MAMGKNIKISSEPFLSTDVNPTIKLINRWNKTRDQDVLNSLLTVEILIVVGIIDHNKNPMIKVMGRSK